MIGGTLENFTDLGYAELGVILDSNKCVELRNHLNIERPLKEEIFYATVEEFQNEGSWHNYAPGRDNHNYLVESDLDLSFIEENKTFIGLAHQLAGSQYVIMKKSIIRSVNQAVLPKWVVDQVHDLGRPNLNPFIRDQYQDIQHFLYTDYHQDKTRPTSNFVTVYIYLDEVQRSDSAIRILEGSHKLGMTAYPHSLRGSWPDDGTLFYSDNCGNHLKCRQAVVTGGAGTVVCFHNLTLHGTVNNESDDPRISLRYLISCPPGTERGSLLDEANRRVIGPHSASNLRLDVAADGSLLPTGCSILNFERDK